MITKSSENLEIYEILIVIEISYSWEIENSIGNVAEIRSNVLASRMRTETHLHSLHSMRTAQADNDHQTIYDLTQDFSHLYIPFSYSNNLVVINMLCCIY